MKRARHHHSAMPAHERAPSLSEQHRKRRHLVYMFKTTCSGFPCTENTINLHANCVLHVREKISEVYVVYMLQFARVSKDSMKASCKQVEMFVSSCWSAEYSCRATNWNFAKGILWIYANGFLTSFRAREFKHPFRRQILNDHLC